MRQASRAQDQRPLPWRWILLGSSALGLLSGLRVLISYRANGRLLALEDALLSGLMEWWLWIPLMPLVLWLARSVEPFARGERSRLGAGTLGLHAVGSVGIAFGHVVLFSALSGLIRSLRYGDALQLNLASPSLMLFAPNLLVYALLICLYGWRVNRRKLQEDADALSKSPDSSEPAAAGAKTAQGETLAFQAGRGQLSLRADEIDWIGAAGNYLELHSKGHSHLVRETLKSVHGRLGEERFVRVHRSTLVRSDAVIGLVDGRQPLVLLSDGARLPIGASYREAMLQRFGQRA